MYRDNEWEKGIYVDNLVKFHCSSCENDFILGQMAVEKVNAQGIRICCPYCGSRFPEETARTEESDAEYLSSELGCIAIYVNKKHEESNEKRK